MRYFLAILFAIVCNIANAQNAPQSNWVVVYSDGDISFSVDKSSLKRNGDIVTAWNTKVEKKGKASVKMLSEYNCKTGQQKTLSFSIYPNVDFSGNPTVSTSPPDKGWSYVVRDTVGEDIKDYACKTAPKGLLDYFK